MVHLVECLKIMISTVCFPNPLKQFSAALLLRQSQAVRFLEVGLVLDWGRFPGFRAAFDPSSIEWEQHPINISQRADEISRGMRNSSKVRGLMCNHYTALVDVISLTFIVRMGNLPG